MQGVPLCARNACVSLLAVSPLIRIMRAHNSGRFFWIQACTSAPFTAPGMRMSEMTPEYFPPLSIFNPSAPEAALATAYPWRSSAARRKAVTEGSSSMSRMGAMPVCVCAYDAVTNAQAEPGAFAGLLGRVKRIKDALRVRDACTVIRDGDFDRFAVQPRADSDVATLPGFLHRVISVVENVQENLL